MIYPTQCAANELGQPHEWWMQTILTADYAGSAAGLRHAGTLPWWEGGVCWRDSRSRTLSVLILKLRLSLKIVMIGSMNRYIVSGKWYRCPFLSSDAAKYYMIRPQSLICLSLGGQQDWNGSFTYLGVPNEPKEVRPRRIIPTLISENGWKSWITPKQSAASSKTGLRLTLVVAECSTSSSHPSH